MEKSKSLQCSTCNEFVEAADGHLAFCENCNNVILKYNVHKKITCEHCGHQFEASNNLVDLCPKCSRLTNPNIKPSPSLLTPSSKIHVVLEKRFDDDIIGDEEHRMIKTIARCIVCSWACLKWSFISMVTFMGVIALIHNPGWLIPSCFIGGYLLLKKNN